MVMMEEKQALVAVSVNGFITDSWVPTYPGKSWNLRKEFFQAWKVMEFYQ